MLPTCPNPALVSFVSQLGPESTMAQVLIRRLEPGYELRHVTDRDRPKDQLRLVPIDGLRKLAQFTVDGNFRPLRSAPNLQTDWRCEFNGNDRLWLAFNHLYPGGIADWYALQLNPQSATDYREFAGRQTGLFENIGQLHDDLVIEVAGQCCNPAQCLKRRCWTAPKLSPENIERKSIIPCLEPCALVLMAASKAT